MARIGCLALATLHPAEYTELLEEGPACRKILRHLGLPDTARAPAPARIDQTQLWPTGPPARPACDAPWTDDVQRSPPRLLSLTPSLQPLETPALSPGCGVAPGG